MPSEARKNTGMPVLSVLRAKMYEAAGGGYCCCACSGQHLMPPPTSGDAVLSVHLGRHPPRPPLPWSWARWAVATTPTKTSSNTVTMIANVASRWLCGRRRGRHGGSRWSSTGTVLLPIATAPRPTVTSSADGIAWLDSHTRGMRQGRGVDSCGLGYTMPFAWQGVRRLGYDPQPPV